jgi:hypothetical protein
MLMREELRGGMRALIASFSTTARLSNLCNGAFYSVDENMRLSNTAALCIPAHISATRVNVVSVYDILHLAFIFLRGLYCVRDSLWRETL